MKKCRSVVTGCVLLTLSLAPLPCFAQAARSGKTYNIGGSASPLRYPDVARDTINDGYLVVNGTGFIEGQLLNAAGVKVGGFTVNASRGLPGQDAQCPRVVFSADLNGGAGGYFITWHETFGGAFAQVRGRMFSTAGTPLTGDLVLTPEILGSVKGLTSNWGMGPAIAYSTVSREFLVTWMGGYTTTNDVKFTRLDLAGNLLQASKTITAGTIDWERDPAVDYDPATDEFLVAYAGYWNAARYGYIGAQRIKAGTGALIGAPRELTQTFAAYIPTVTYNPATAEYLIAWYNATSSSAAMYGMSVRGSDGVPTGPVRLMSGKYISYDALDVKYNAKSGDFLLVTYGAAPQAWEDAAVSIKSDGTPYDNGFIVTNTPDVRPVRSGGDGNYSPRLIDDSSTGRWLVVTDSVFTAVYGQFVASQNTSGPGTPRPRPPPAGPRLSADQSSLAFGTISGAPQLRTSAAVGPPDADRYGDHHMDRVPVGRLAASLPGVGHRIERADRIPAGRRHSRDEQLGHHHHYRDRRVQHHCADHRLSRRPGRGHEQKPGGRGRQPRQQPHGRDRLHGDDRVGDRRCGRDADSHPARSGGRRSGRTGVPR